MPTNATDPNGTRPERSDRPAADRRAFERVVAERSGSNIVLRDRSDDDAWIACKEATVRTRDDVR